MPRADAFADRPSLALRYAHEARALFVTRLSISCWLAIVLVPLFIWSDRILHPQLVRPFLLIRFALVTNAGLMLFALRTKPGRRHVGGLTFWMFCATGWGIALMTVFNGGGSSPYYAGINLVVLAAAVLMPFETAVSAALVTTQIGAYVGLCLAWGGVPDVRTFSVNLFFLCSTAIITVVSHAVAAAARRRELVQRIALEEVGRHRDEFLANITHELRTPLAAILGFCEMLADYMSDATSQQQTWLARIRDNALTLYRLIVQLLDFSKIEAGAMRLIHERFALDAIVTKVAADMRAIAGPSGVAIGVDIASDVPAVMGDPARAEEIVTNLASNALKFSSGRPVLLRLRHATIDAEPPWDRIVPDPGPDTAGRNWVEVAVIDRGDGIRLEDLRRLFVAFLQLDGSSTRRQGGTGLGLAISARLAAVMHGHIAVRSTPGVGSTFALLFPVADGEPAVTVGGTESGGGSARRDRGAVGPGGARQRAFRNHAQLEPAVPE